MLFPCDKHQWTEWRTSVPLTSNFEPQSDRSCPICGASETDDGSRIRFTFGGSLPIYYIPHGTTEAIYYKRTE